MLSAYEFPWEQVFHEEFSKAIADEQAATPFTPDEWFKAGRGSGEDESWWRVHGPEQAARFGLWFENSPETSVWVTPDGQPAIELGLNVTFGDVEVVMFIDLILVMGTALVVWDFKSGSTVPPTNEQLGLYACGVELAYGKQWRPAYGAHFLTRGRGKTEDDKVYAQDPVPLDGDRYSVGYFTEQFTMMNRAVELGVFVANPGDKCRRCGVNYACPAVGGAEAGKYRRLNAGSNVFGNVQTDPGVRLPDVHSQGGLDW